VKATRLAAPLRARLAEPWRQHDGDRMLAAVHDLELASLRHGALVDVSGEHELGAGINEPREHTGPSGERRLPGAPRRAEQMVM
jgi:hypothetical protein